MSTDPQILSLVLRWQELRRQGRPITIEELCIDCPEAVEAVEQQVRALTSVGGFVTPPEVPRTASPALASGAAVDPSLPEYAGRFRLLCEIAHGGMGVVLRAHDPAIGRDVAIKVMLAAHRGIAAAVRRFFDEARLTGQLQHPGIAPVYDLGELPDGRPYFAMKLIQGRTLAELLAERPNPGHDLPRFLRDFEAICRAVGYAHSCGVIHRDLKPLNIMVGAFGEVQVMDWGLAKVLDQASRERQRPEGEHGDTQALHPGRDEESWATEGDRTQTGWALGTPGYMAPEQARGEAGADQRSDVFGLGAILCAILTGQPPFLGACSADIVFQTARGDLAGAFARLDGCGADAELVRLAKTCLSAQRDERPADAAAVATYLTEAQERLRQAELARARAEEERKRRRLAQAQEHNNRGDTLYRQGRFREAEAAYREAIGLAPDDPVLHCRLGAVLQEQGRFGEAVEAFRRGHTLGSQVPGWRAPSATWLRDAERLVELDRQLPDVLGGTAPPASAAERLELAGLCQHPTRCLHAGAARLAAEAFALAPALADDLDIQCRYNAACSAVLAATGRAKDAHDLADETRAALRRQALQWLRADLALYAGLAERDDAVQGVVKQLAYWQDDADLAAVRDADALARLPEAERIAWQQFWVDVAALGHRGGRR
jgi:tetratricopeptide (TPR) repeat protein